MRKLLIFLIIIMTILLIISCQNFADKKFTHIRQSNEFAFFEDSVCYLKFKNKINGFDVKVKLRYFNVTGENEIRGRAEITFFKDGILYLFFDNPAFKLRHQGLNKIKNGDIVEVEYPLLPLDQSKLVRLQEYRNFPFFFLDVDFDGKKELILSYSGMGQRNSTAFEAYSLDYSFNNEKNNLPTYDYLYDKLRDISPYSNLDELTEINYSTNEISTFDYGGYSDSKKRIYKRIDNDIRLDRIEDYDSLGYVLARCQVLKIDTITTYHNNREYLFK